MLVEPDRARLYTDFRYIERAQAAEGVEVVETPRAVLPALAELLSGTVGFEADHVTYAGWQTLGANGLALVPTQGVVEALRAVKEPAELDAIRAAAAISDRAFEALARERFTGRTERELAWRLDQLLPRRSAATGPAFETDRRGRRERRAAARDARRRARSRPATLVASTPARRSAATAPTARARSRPATCRTSWREVYEVCLARAAGRRSPPFAPGRDRRRGRRRARAR